MTMAESTPIVSYLSAQVRAVSQKMEGMLDWIRSQANTTVKNNDKDMEPMEKAMFPPFRVEDWIGIPTYNGCINVMVLNSMAKSTKHLLYPIQEQRQSCSYDTS